MCLKRCRVPCSGFVWLASDRCENVRRPSDHVARNMRVALHLLSPMDCCVKQTGMRHDCVKKEKNRAKSREMCPWRHDLHKRRKKIMRGSVTRHISRLNVQWTMREALRRKPYFLLPFPLPLSPFPLSPFPLPLSPFPFPLPEPLPSAPPPAPLDPFSRAAARLAM